MYRRPKFLEILLQIRQEMSREADYDIDLFAEIIRSGKISKNANIYDLNIEKDVPKPTRKIIPKTRKAKI